MKVALIFAAAGAACEDAVLGPFRAPGFIAGLQRAGIEPLAIAVVAAGGGNAAAGGPGVLGPGWFTVRHDRLAGLVADEQPDVVQTFGPEHRAGAVWPLARTAPLLVHCVSCWPEEPQKGTMPAVFASLAARRARHASRHVGAVVGTSRAAIGGLLGAGYFARAGFSALVRPPVGAAPTPPGEAARSPTARNPVPVFGIWAPQGGTGLQAFLSHAAALTGRPDAVRLRVAVRTPPPATEPALAFVTATGVDDFLPAIDVLAVPAYDDTIAPALIAALRLGKAVIVPDRGGGAELIEYGRHGLMFSAGSAYHFANAINLVSEAWSERPVLLAHGGPAIARTEPAAVAAAFTGIWNRALAGRRSGFGAAAASG